MTALEHRTRRRVRTSPCHRRNQINTATMPQLKRQLPHYQMLNELDLTILEEHADNIGEVIGLEFRDDLESLDLFKKAGAIVVGENVKFPKGMLREIITSTAQSEFIHHARNPEKSVVIGGDYLTFAPSYGSPFVSDLDEGRRYAKYEDFKKIVKLVYQSPWLNISGGTVCEPMDIAVNKRHLDMIYAHVKYSDKPYMGGVTSGSRAQDCVDMSKIVFGDEFVEQNCVMASIINANSPLVYDKTMLDALKVYARHNQACIVTPFILTGAMGPVTIEAAIAQALIEAMAGMALIQLINPGCPMIMGTFTSSMSLKSGAPTFGMPEPSLGYFAIGQLAKRLGVPLRGGGCLTASKSADYQAAQESSDTLMVSVLSGIHLVMHSAGWQEGGLAWGYEKFMLDADHLGMMYRMMQGLQLNSNNLAMEAYQEVGPGNHYLGCDHTMKNYQTALYNPELNDSESFEQWQENGCQDSIKRANLLMKRKLADYKAPELDDVIDQKLQDFISNKKSSMPDALE